MTDIASQGQGGIRRWPRFNGLHRTLTVLLLVAGLSLLVPGGTAPADAAGGALRRPAGYNTLTLARGDNNSVGPVTMPFAVTTKPTHPTTCYINTNGNITFAAANASFDPAATLVSLKIDGYYPFWADVDTTNTVGGTVTYSSNTNPPQVNGHNAFIVTWDGVGYHAGHTDKLNTFQLVLIDRSDIGVNNYDIEFNYDQIQWDRATDPVASVGYARSGIAQRSPATGWELPGSGIAGAQLDGGANALTTHSQASSVPGRYIWQIRNGNTAAPPSISLAFDTKALEGNSKTPSPGYAGYSGTGDATAILNEPYITLTSMVRSPAIGAYLPLGDNTITWTATDSNGSVTAATQHIIVADTTAPTNPTTLSSSTHVANVWSKVPAATVSWTGDAADTCSGVAGYSAVWANTAVLPAAVNNTPAATLTTSKSLEDGTWYLNLRTVDVSGNWTGGFKSFGPVLVDTVPPVTSSNVPGGWSTASTFNLTLTPVDPTSPVPSTSYLIGAGPKTAYTAPVPITVDGTYGISFLSVDAAGNTETTKTATLRKDSILPSTPGTPVASALTTSTVQVTWVGSTDTGSGVATYRVYRDGTLLTTTASVSFSDSGIIPGSSHVYRIAAVDVAGNVSSQSGPLTVNFPAMPFTLTMSVADVDMGTVQPGDTATVVGATTARVAGVGNFSYTLSVAGQDFSASNPLSPTPILPVGALSFATRGQVTLARQSFFTSGRDVATQVGSSASAWEHDYVFDYSFASPWNVEPDTYTGHVVYTLIQQ